MGIIISSGDNFSEFSMNAKKEFKNIPFLKSLNKLSLGPEAGYWTPYLQCPMFRDLGDWMCDSIIAH